MPSSSSTASAIPVARRVNSFSYAIRNIVAEAKKVEATGKTVHYLNIGDPNQFGFQTPPHLIEAVIKAMRDGHNGYVPSPGIAPILSPGGSQLGPGPTCDGRRWGQAPLTTVVVGAWRG